MKQALRRASYALCAMAFPTAMFAQATFLGEVALRAPLDTRFGGLSAIEVSDDGAMALVLSDRTSLFTVSLEREPEGITRARVCCGTAVTWADGMDLPTGQRDSEGLAVLPDGRIAISFEGGVSGRVAFHGHDGVQLALTPPIPLAADLPWNGGFEGVAVDGTGRIYIVPETMPSGSFANAPRPLLRLDNGIWQVAADLRRQDEWSPTALDFDDEGRLYMLERRVLLPLGFAARLTRFGIDANGDLSSGQVILETSLGHHDNLEGLSLWRDATGRLIATMVSDDDFMAFRSSTLVEYVLPD